MKTDEGLVPADYARTKELGQMLQAYNDGNATDILCTKRIPGALMILDADDQHLRGLSYAELLGTGRNRKVCSQSQCLQIVLIWSALTEFYIRSRPKNNDESDAAVIQKFPAYIEEFGRHLRQLLNSSVVESSDIFRNLLTYLTLWKNIVAR